MRVLRIWRVLCALGLVGASLCVNELEYEGNFAEYYDNEISPDQQEEETPAPPCQAAEFSLWDKLFIALEDSHMRQSQLLEALERCDGGTLSLRARLDQLAEGSRQQCPPGLEQATARLREGLLELREEEAERERRWNATLHQLLRGGREANARLKRLEEGGGPGGAGHRPTPPRPRPGGLGAAFGAKASASGPEEREGTPTPDMAAMQEALVAIATQLQQVHLQLSGVIERAGRTEEARGSPRGQQ